MRKFYYLIISNTLVGTHAVLKRKVTDKFDESTSDFVVLMLIY